MSFISGKITASLGIQRIIGQIEAGRLEIMRAARAYGEARYQEIVPRRVNTDDFSHYEHDDDPHLAESMQGFNSADGVWFTVDNWHAPFLEFGYHDRRGGWHEGRHFMRTLQQDVAAETMRLSVSTLATIINPATGNLFLRGDLAQIQNFVERRARVPRTIVPLRRGNGFSRFDTLPPPGSFD